VPHIIDEHEANTHMSWLGALTDQRRCRFGCR